MAFTEKYVTVSGGGLHDGSSEANAWTLAEAISNVAAGDRVNVKAGTYSSGTTHRIFSASGTDTSPIWWRGYKTSIGDLDSRPTTQRIEGTDMPLFTSTTGYYYFDGSNQKISNIHFESAPFNAGSAVILIRGDNFVLFRCRAISNSSNIGAIEGNTSRQVLVAECYFENTTTGADVVQPRGQKWVISKCIIRGGDIGVLCPINYATRIVDSIIYDSAESKIQAGGFLMVSNCTLYNAADDNIRLYTLSYYDAGVIINNVFDTAGGYAINQNTGTDTSKVLISNNAYRDGSFGAGRLNGISEDLEFESINETVIPFEDVASLDFTLKSTAGGHGQQIIFEVDGPTSYRDLGAIQHADPSGGGAVLHPLRSN